MSWQDRQLEAAYTSPSGVRLPFGFENVAREFDKLGGAFNFPGGAGTFAQGLGKSGRRYPLRVFLWGADYDLAAAAFEDALAEDGVGRLEHPAYGIVDVVPLGTITRRDDLKTAANQAVLEFTLWETVDILRPTSAGDPTGEVLDAVDAFNAAMPEQFGGALDTSTAGLRATIAGAYNSAVQLAKTQLRPLVDAQAQARNQFDTIARSLDEGLSTLVGTPVTLAAQASALIQTPALIASNLAAQLDTYQTMLDVLAGRDEPTANRFYSNAATASAVVSASVLAAAAASVETRPEAIQAADAVLAQFDQYVAWADSNYTALSATDTGEAYQALHRAAMTCAGALVELAFTLKQERVIVLDRSRTIIDVAAEVYGAVDAHLDALINDNALSGDELLILPEGRRIAYYI